MALNNVFVVGGKLLEGTLLQSLPGDTEEEGGGGGDESERQEVADLLLKLLCDCAQVY